MRLATRSWVDGQDVPGAALAERIYSHCSKADGFCAAGGCRWPRRSSAASLSADHGGLTDGALVEMLRERSGAVPVSATLLRRMRDSVRPYPIRRVDADLFGGRANVRQTPQIARGRSASPDDSRVALLLSRGDLARLLDVEQVIEAVAGAFAAYSAGER